MVLDDDDSDGVPQRVYLRAASSGSVLPAGLGGVPADTDDGPGCDCVCSQRGCCDQQQLPSLLKSVFAAAVVVQRWW